MTIKDKSIQALGLAAILAGSSQAAFSIELLSGFGGVRGYGELALAPNDDDSSGPLNLPFSINLFGNSYESFYVNNNGNITFNSGLGTFTPNPFPVADQPMIAPYWGDVDTRGNVDPVTGDFTANDGTSNNVWVASPNANTVIVTWDQVGYYEEHTDLLNDFQLVLRNRADTGTGNFDIDFRYHSLQWTTGDASDGAGGLAGTNPAAVAAQAGYDAGNGVDFQVLPGSLTDQILDLQNTSNVAPDQPGLWTFAIRNGMAPGTDPGNPLLPVVHDNGWQFDFNVGPNQTYFVDPLIAIGYDFFVDSGPNILSALLPSVGDDLFDICLWDGSAWGSCAIANAGVEFFFGAGGVDRFRVLGIETSAGLDPNDTAAFVTGLTFDGSGTVSLRQVPITLDVGSPVPEIDAATGTGALALLSGVLAMVNERRRRRPSV